MNQELSPEQEEALLQTVKRELWKRGDLTYLLDVTQLEIYGFIRGCPTDQTVIEFARQGGKSFLLCVLAIEECVRNPGCRVNYVTKTFSMAKDITGPTMRKILRDCPREMKPEFKAAESRWVFPNGPEKEDPFEGGSQIVLVGADTELGADRGRGPSIALNLLDEAGFMEVLEYLLDSVLGPTTRRTGGKTVLVSTPSLTTDHPFKRIVDAAIATESHIKRDFWSPGFETEERKLRLVESEAAKKNMTVPDFMRTSYFRREYLCEWVLDESNAVVPEFADVRERTVKELERPAYFDCYVSIDPGMDDFTGILFAIYDFRKAITYIEHEALLQKANTRTIANHITSVEREHYRDDQLGSWTRLRPDGRMGSGGGRRLRIADDPHKRLCADLQSDFNLLVCPALKDDRSAADNNMRILIGACKVWIHPRCVNLIHQLSTGTKDPRTGDLKRTRGQGHLDLLAALRYLLRSVDENHNPLPPDPILPGQFRTFAPDARSLTDVLYGGTNIGRRRGHGFGRRLIRRT